MRRICMSALLTSALLVSASTVPALAQVAYPYVPNQPVYVTQPAVQGGQQYYVYAPPNYPAGATRYASAVPQSYPMAAPRGYAPAYTGTAAPQGYATAAPAYTGTVAPRYAAAAPVYAAPAQAYAAPAPQPLPPIPAPPPPPAPASSSGGGFLEAIFGGPTIQAHVYAPFAPEYQTPALQPTVINPPAAYAPSSQGNMATYPVDPKYDRQVVDYKTEEKPGTIVIDTPNKFLYLVEEGGKALRYGIGVGRPGFTWSGVKEVSAKREWPDWRPPSDMLQRRPDLPRYMPGGIDNPLGARAMYLGSTLYRIHGSNEPWTIGTNVSSGCIRMRNDDVSDLYDRVKIGTKVIVI
jgi:lipoprotein-anchoring transpeptidase ErfK/SrfK